MKVPKVRVLNEWCEIDGYLHVDFMLDIDYHNERYTEDSGRMFNIPLDEVEEFVRETGLLEKFEDQWDYASESHTTIDFEIDFDRWMDDYLDDVFVREYIEHYITYNDIPDIFVLD